ncbi:hypothetical protein X566_07445 [Afipia sp. P52-10]|jgi:hypothetical protein|uniref:DUF4167 domain-containing protein n=1 Tax=Afipia sp. P52-10 TaxID=1429916 RepID=UPI0003DF1812|nr:DUF4167 domain-containing protein [Afipia sp. P52-10]ETR77488.1 hypothetical protein X566_07445 [Afipia sp. P52-10]
MRNGQNKRMRNRNNNHNNNNNRRGQNPLTRVYESNGPEIKIRGTASHLAEKYVQLARDAQGSGDPVAAENYYQHAEHYFRIIAAAQEQFRQNQPQQHQQRIDNDVRDDAGDDGDNEFSSFGAEPGFAPQPYPAREPQPYQRDPQYRENRQQPQPTAQANDGDIDRLPSFITGGQPQPNANYENGERNNGEQRAERGERFQHRRRRRHGPRPDGTAALPLQNEGPAQAGD